MALADYSHWNEDAAYIWWEEEGKHYDQDFEDWRESEYEAADAFSEELAEYDDEALLEISRGYSTLTEKKCIEWELKERGLL